MREKKTQITLCLDMRSNVACEAKRLDIGTRQKIRLRVTIPLLANTQLYPVSAQSFSHRSYVGRNAECCEQCDPFEVAYKLTRVFKIEQGNHLSIGRQLRWALGKLLVVMMRPQINHPRGAGNISSSLQSSSAQHELSLSSTVSFGTFAGTVPARNPKRPSIQTPSQQ